MNTSGKTNPQRPDSPRAWSTVTYPSLAKFLAAMRKLKRKGQYFQASAANLEISIEKKP